MVGGKVEGSSRSNFLCHVPVVGGELNHASRCRLSDDGGQGTPSQAAKFFAFKWSAQTEQPKQFSFPLMKAEGCLSEWNGQRSWRLSPRPRRSRPACSATSK